GIASRAYGQRGTGYGVAETFEGRGSSGDGEALRLLCPAADPAGRAALEPESKRPGGWRGRGAVSVPHFLPAEFQGRIRDRQFQPALAIAGEADAAEGPRQGPPPYGRDARRQGR